MFVKQISVFLENKPGRLFNLTKTLAENGLDIFHITVAETSEYGVIRCVTKDSGRAIEVLKGAGFAVSVTDLVGVDIDDRPGSLNEVLAFLSEKNVQIEYLYSFSRNAGKNAAILLKIDNNPEAAAKLLTENGIKLITDLTK